MTRLQEVYEILQKENLQKQDTKEYIRVSKPTKSFTFKQFNIPQTRKISSQRVTLSKVLAFIDIYKFTRFSDKEGGYSVIGVATTNKRLLSMFNKDQMQVSRFIQFMKEIGLLAEYDNSYQYNAFYSKDNKCKQYVYSYYTEVDIKKYCIDNNINKYIIRNNIYNSKHIRSIDNFDKKSVRFSSKLNLLRPENWSTKQFEEYLTSCLYENYPQLEHYQNLADMINDVYYSDDMDRQIQFVPTFTWRKGNKCVIKIGIRATNCLVSATKEELLKNGEKSPLTKEDVKNRYGLKYKFDVKSSVPRVIYLMNKGEWLNNKIDLYEKMNKSFIDLCPSEATEWNEETRKIFKEFFMRGNFDTYSQIAGHIKRQISMKTEYNKESWTDLDYLFRSYKKAIENTLGSIEYDSEIFFHESCIYMDVLFELLKRNVSVWQCYDEWNTDSSIEDIEDIIYNKAIYYYYTYKEEERYNTIVNIFVSDENYIEKYLDKENKAINELNNGGKYVQEQGIIIIEEQTGAPIEKKFSA